VAYSTADGTATAGSDYTATAGVLTIPAGETSATITVPILNDTALENPETFTLNLSAPSNGIIADGQGVGTITSEDLPGVYISDVRHLEGNTGQRNLYFTVSLTEPAPFSALVAYATADDTATAGSDYTAMSGTFTFAPGETSKSLAVPVTGDTNVEGDETFFVNLSSPNRAIIIKPQGMATIVDDDTPLSVSINDVTLAEGNDGTTNAVFTITLSGIRTQPVTVNYATADGTATAGTDYTATTGTVTVPAGQTTAIITVPVIGDLANEGDETFTVTLSGAVGATIADGTGTGTITNDDVAAGFSYHKTSLLVSPSTPTSKG
jgi:chitinase